jgi:hypothetical protein
MPSDGAYTVEYEAPPKMTYPFELTLQVEYVVPKYGTENGMFTSAEPSSTLDREMFVGADGAVAGFTQYVLVGPPLETE